MSRAAEIYPADRLTLREVGLRDGLQMVKTWPDTAAKEDWIRREHAAGVRHFEIGSFLPATRFPQFADVPDLARVAAVEGVHGIALALNERGVRDALDAPVGEVGLVISATEAHSRANQNRSRAEALDLVRMAVEERPERGPLIGVGISMAFGCSISGAVPQAEVLKICEALLEAGVDLIGLADTVGYGGPDAVAALTRDARALAGDVPICIHLHDTRGLGLANAAAAMDAGARVLDGALGGLGGCPFAPGATGNVVMEDLAFLAATKGVETGIDLDALIGVREILATAMPGETLHGALARAGPPKLEAAPA
ncbi:beta/alpha barrel domain-containing protein [Ovoidimarina sediminis]|uniref:hydroxymethylglutaryl-CoA lyase n=1 Tax=Ovoidimarina sediminis TaxID=3079856 RepID=UPI00290F6B33|nr:hydroxymethylglutaryl-CoA lyase [Rhodophyticola sp. MJ-SS7]MDU8943657.1 hydroxymethylglutaryl-CoA lyase [Rhodophyticola sp. MJ-SS7]